MSLPTTTLSHVFAVSWAGYVSILYDTYVTAHHYSYHVCLLSAELATSVQ